MLKLQEEEEHERKMEEAMYPVALDREKSPTSKESVPIGEGKQSLSRIRVNRTRDFSIHKQTLSHYAAAAA